METKPNFEKESLLPAVVQDAHSGEVLMVAYMNEEAYRLTLESGQAHFWSRSR
jgi:phosphoribosyl-AMP cyclohydrolase